MFNIRLGLTTPREVNGTRAYAFLSESNSEYDQLTADATAQASFGGYLYQADTSPGQFPAYDEIGFHCRSTGQLVGSLQGFVSEVKANAAETNYNFVASGTAPNYFKGLTEHEGGIALTSLKDAAFLGTDADGNIIAVTGGGTGGGITQDDADNRYLRIDSGAGSQQVESFEI